MTKIVKPLGTINRELSKQEILEMAIVDADAIINAGNYDLLQVYIEMKRYEAYLSGILKHLKTPSFTQAAEQGEKSFSYNHAKVSISQRTKYDYSIDENWTELDAEIEKLKQQRKAREQYLQASSEEKTLIDEETGEVVMTDFKLPKEVKYGLTVTI